MATLNTSLSQIKSFNPCSSGWKVILGAHTELWGTNDLVVGGVKHLTESDYTKLFPVSECVQSNSISDVCWLLGKLERKEVLVRFARLCADSVAHLKNSNSGYAQRRAAADAYADAYAAAADADADAYAAYADADAYAYADAYADAYAYAYAYEKQIQLNKQFLLQAIVEFESGTIS